MVIFLSIAKAWLYMIGAQWDDSDEYMEEVDDDVE